MVIFGGMFAPRGQAQGPLPPPGFHHLHLNSTNPEAAIDFYTRQISQHRQGELCGRAGAQIG
jgi:hypothetical protein